MTCQAERNVARRIAARKHLEGCGFAVHRKSIEELVPSWHVSGYAGWFSNEQLMAIAVEYGFDPEGVSA